jgi:hypothetical protein
VLAAEAAKDFISRLGGAVVPGNVQFVVGSISSSGVHHFNEEQVMRAFMGSLK